MALRIDERMAAVLDAFAEHGDMTTGMLVDETGMTRPTLKSRLDQLAAAECIEYKHENTALWTLIEDPRDDG
ncbi:helix-turn-helix domain-containing protein [Halococcus sp. PRR34]|uniref:helix-turn-helix domain-containing protein n=1 Tax=Halococcus sp. PRR34 TaxID=3020830 RepID=UPI002361CACE|nr:helix-turn-helix domain-containing protein [Halococcus sp. PRR34]